MSSTSNETYVQPSRCDVCRGTFREDGVADLSVIDDDGVSSAVVCVTCLELLAEKRCAFCGERTFGDTTAQTHHIDHEFVMCEDCRAKVLTGRGDGVSL